MGLQDIDVRISDKVNYIYPHKDREIYNTRLNNIIQAGDWDRARTPEEKESIIDLFMNRGVSREEVEAFIHDEEAIKNYIEQNQNVSILKALCLIITSAIKVRARKSITQIETGYKKPLTMS